jgi:curved DNA-binding protein CbpA
VSVNAPQEVIAAAYKALSRQYHPDMNPGNPDAEKIMRIVNASYEVLSDPEKRQAHDEWIAVKLLNSNNNAENTPDSTSSQHAEAQYSKILQVVRHLARNLWTYLFIGMIGFGLWAANEPPKPSGLPEYVAEPTAELANSNEKATNFIRPKSAPNGSSWPDKASYIKGYPIARADGLSKLTIDNSSNPTDVFVKLIALDTDKTLPVRHAFIPANSSFTMNKIRAGNYDIRHMDLSDGSLSRSESFALEEISEPAGVRFSVTTLTLFKVANGNMQSYSLAPEEF